MNDVGAYSDLGWPEERHVFADEFPGELTREIPAQTMTELVYGNDNMPGAVPDQEVPDMSDEAIEIVEDSDAIPEFISNDTPTAPYKINPVVRNAIGDMEENPFSESPTVVEEVQVIPSNDNDESEVA